MIDKIDSLVFIFEWLKYISPLKYSMELILLYEFENVFMGSEILSIWGYGDSKTTCRVVLAIMAVFSVLVAYG